MTVQDKEANKQLALDFYRSVVVKADFSRLGQLIRPDYIQHSTVADDGPEGLKIFAAGLAAEFPNAEVHFKQVLADGDRVMLHCHLIRFPGDPGIAAMDIFRIEDGLLAEHWDCFMDVPTSMMSARGLF